jgi:hypothetical protein
VAIPSTIAAAPNGSQMGLATGVKCGADIFALARRSRRYKRASLER